MALVISDTAYAGTFASYFWLPATFGMDTIQKGAVYVQDGIKKSHTIGRIDFANPLQPRTATPTSSGTYTIDGRSLTPLDVMVYTEFNPRDFEQHWLAEQLSPTLLARELPVTAENYMLQMGLNRALEFIETGIWMGSTTYTAAAGSTGNGQLKFFDGFLKKMVNDSSIYQVPSPLPLSAAASSGSVYNIVDAMNALLNLAATNNKALLSRPTRYERMKFFMSINSEQIYQTFITTSLTFKGVNTTERGINKFKGYEIVPLAGMADDTILFCEGLMDTSSNLYVGMNSVSDDQLQLQRLQANSELFFLKGLMKYDVQYGFPKQIFLFTTLTASSFNA
ncbi:hypothetical protein F0L74_09775 [Chitinophaga agrisoli]|uniref:HK97 family phage major capsid protein n=1 Tax=Chitinophaga agrisoli TaxID=2607653 RepID=A0A5B2VX20_9BACT|nr:hypothetical protein [Chitinophaga agrisoli]KAA2242807.1 hypothetical protein F0L74_09775 [Chitinophaga agrisoli]